MRSCLTVAKIKLERTDQDKTLIGPFLRFSPAYFNILRVDQYSTVDLSFTTEM